MDIKFLLGICFITILYIITFTDMFYGTVDDKVIIVGITLVLIFQFCLGQIIFSLTGAGVGFIISFAVYLFGNKYFKTVPMPKPEDSSLKDVYSSLTLPLVPFFTVAIVIHALIPEGLTVFLLEIIFLVQSSTLLSVAIFIVAGIFLIWSINHRTAYLDSTGFIEEDNRMTAFGTGDITASLFIGSVLGWQNFIAVFWLALVIQTIIGAIILLKKVVFKWT